MSRGARRDNGVITKWAECRRTTRQSLAAFQILSLCLFYIPAVSFGKQEPVETASDSEVALYRSMLLEYQSAGYTAHIFEATVTQRHVQDDTSQRPAMSAVLPQLVE